MAQQAQSNLVEAERYVRRFVSTSHAKKNTKIFVQLKSMMIESRGKSSAMRKAMQTKVWGLATIIAITH